MPKEQEKKTKIEKKRHWYRVPKKGKDGKNLLKAHPSPEKRKNKKRQTANPPGWWAKAMIRQRKNSQKRNPPKTRA